MLAVMKREILSYFTTPLAYVFLAVFYGFSGLFLWMDCLSGGSASMSGVFMLMFFIMMIMIPILTMRTLSEERKQKTDQLTLTSPVSLFGIVMGKFLGAFVIFLCGAVMLLVYALILSAAVSASGAAFGWAAFWGNFAGIILMGGAFIAVGIFVSGLTENQFISAVGSIGANILIFMFDVIPGYIPNETLKNVLSSLSVFDRFNEFTTGIFSLKNVVFFVSFIALFIFFTVRVMQRRRYA